MYLSRAHKVDDDRIALSNQFMSKTARNLAANPRADLLLCDPHTHDEYRLTLQYERTDRRGHVFDRLRADIDSLAALVGMQDVFRLRAADIFRVLAIEEVPHKTPAAEAGFHSVVRPSSDELTRARRAGAADRPRARARRPRRDRVALARRSVRLRATRWCCCSTNRAGTCTRSPAAASATRTSVPRCRSVMGRSASPPSAARSSRVDGISQLRKYSRSIRREYEESGVQQAREIPMPGLASTRRAGSSCPRSRSVNWSGCSSPRASGSPRSTSVDEHILGVAASLVANAVGNAREDRPRCSSAARCAAPVRRAAQPAAPAGSVVVRYFASDASTFFDGDYLIKGVAGRILWSLLSQYVATGRTEFTNRELRLDPTLELPGFKDNLESRLLLLKRRLDERDAPVRIEKTSRGRFRIQVNAQLQLEPADSLTVARRRRSDSRRWCDVGVGAWPPFRCTLRSDRARLDPLDLRRRRARLDEPGARRHHAGRGRRRRDQPHRHRRRLRRLGGSAEAVPRRAPRSLLPRDQDRRARGRRRHGHSSNARSSGWASTTST